MVFHIRKRSNSIVFFYFSQNMWFSVVFSSPFMLENFVKISYTSSVIWRKCLFYPTTCTCCTLSQYINALSANEVPHALSAN